MCICVHVSVACLHSQMNKGLLDFVYVLLVRVRVLASVLCGAVCICLFFFMLRRLKEKSCCMICASFDMMT